LALISILLKVIFYLHAHGDHILDVEAIAERTKAVIVSNAEIASYYATKGFQAHPMITVEAGILILGR
jgi:glyoxylase-like metal-dependent hydrolase (beta-lactamase superfamily II)